jgi:DNA (cytosine-5)-methyltransferase 1
MKYGSVCSGIEAASVAWHNLGWEPQWLSEIEQFPSEVLKHRFPAIPNLGDMTTINQNPIADERPIDLLVGGTPCQSFSVAGLRKGLADPRGNLMLTFLSIADKLRPKWIVWENVPGVLSSNGGKDFGTFLGALGELGYGFAYRVLDAQYFGVAQRRRRVFVVGYLGDWRVAAAVLFERESLSGNTKPSRKKGEEVASDVEGSVGDAGRWVSPNGEETIGTLRARDYKGLGNDDLEQGRGLAIKQPTIIDRAAFSQGPNAQYESRIETGETMSCLVARGPHAVAQPIPIHDQATRFNGKRGNKQDGKGNGLGIGQEYDPSPTLTKGDRHAVAQPIAFEPGKMQRLGYGYSDNGTSPTLRSEPGDNQLAVAQPIAFKVRGGCEGGGKGYLGQEEQAFTISATQDQQIAQPIAVDVYNQKTTGDKFGVVREQHGTNMNAVLQPIAVDWRTAQVDQGITQTLKTDLAKMSGPCIAVDTFNQTINERTSQTIGSSASDVNHYGAVLQPIAVDVYNQSIDGQTSATITEAVGGTNTSGPKVMHSMAIRRLTPKECERLQGFPDDWTKIPYRNKEADQCPDGPRYKACGNSMAVPVMRWIGERINLIESML